MPKALPEETNQQIVNLWLNHNYNQQQIADTLGVGYSTVHRVIKEYSTDGSHEPPKDMPMPEPIVQADELATMTEEHTAEVPEAVLKAVQDKIDSLTTQIAVNCERIKSITEQNDRMKERSEALQKWLKEVKA